jgi:hypothetical protein
VVRPRNPKADLAAGMITGTMASVTAFTLSVAWWRVLIAIQWGGTAAIPYGILLGMLLVLVLIAFVCVIGTLAAGSLLRRQERVHQMIGPYFERLLPAALLVMSLTAVSYKCALGELSQIAGLPWAIPLLALALTGVLRRWHWMLRVCLHAGWVAYISTWLVLNSRWHGRFPN